uniref:Superoxide dismutase copper/zinc binding domain-containing protein n=1 Tax=Magallana gigas TaxID=29159 RepID=A0A8W8MFD8_MAGGI
MAHHRHGLQIHEYGDMSQGCGSVGELYHYEHAPNHENPGDLGDIVDDASGAVHSSRAFDWLHIDLTDGILGRSLVILQGDHNHPDSEQIACCVIGRAQAH